MLLDYLDQPILNGIYVALIIQRLLPAVPYVVLAAACVGLVTYLNLRSIRAAARANEVMLAIMTAVIGLFIILAIRYLFKSQGMSGLFSMQPFYDPHTFSTHAIATGTSLAALTYIGFDGVTLLSEEVKNPKRNVLLAGVMVCVFTGIFSGLARLPDLPAPGNRLYGCCQDGRPLVVVQRHGGGPRRVESRLRPHRTTGGDTAPLQHGAR
jgi:amino acid transporter